MELNRTAIHGFARSVAAMLGAQVVLVGIATHLSPLHQRPIVMFAVTAISMMVLGIITDASRKRISAAIILSTFVSVVFIYSWRRLTDPLGYVGSIPPAIEIPALAVSAALTILLAAFVAVMFHRSGRASGLRWPAVSLLSLLVVTGLSVLWTGRDRDPIPEMLTLVSEREGNPVSLGNFERQELSFWLGAFGRGHEAVSFSTESAVVKRLAQPPSDFTTDDELEISSSTVSWQEAVRKIASTERIVIIMEAHNATQHREWIGQTLPIFRQAGFVHYAAEALGESGEALAQRGYPVHSTGYYVEDPRFGNLLRRAVDLGFTIHEYEAMFTTDVPQREQQQADELARIIESNPRCKMVVHVGYAHAFKKPVPNSGTWMAARLWQKTGIEPYCIYQGFENFDTPRYPRIAELASVENEPQLLVPPPSCLTDLQFKSIRDGVVDALVIHPLSKKQSPKSRMPAFSSGMIRIAGQWLGSDWPVVVGAFRPSESYGAIALDQVMLREGESHFELWIPEGPQQLRVTSTDGNVSISVENDRDTYLLRESKLQ